MRGTELTSTKCPELNFANRYHNTRAVVVNKVPEDKKITQFSYLYEVPIVSGGVEKDHRTL